MLLPRRSEEGAATDPPLSPPSSASEAEEVVMEEEMAVAIDQDAQTADLVATATGAGGGLALTSTSIARRSAVEALSAALDRSLDRSTEASGLLGDELEAVRAMLQAEAVSEEERLGGLTELIGKLEAVIDGKAAVVKRETVRGAGRSAVCHSLLVRVLTASGGARRCVADFRRPR